MNGKIAALLRANEEMIRIDREKDRQIAIQKEQQRLLQLQAAIEYAGFAPANYGFGVTLDAEDLRVPFRVPFRVRAPEPLPAPVKSAIAPAAVADSPDAEYCDMAKSLGFSIPEMLCVEFESFLAANFIEVYDYHRVTEYMDNLVAREQQELWRKGMIENIVWGWRPLRAKDASFAASMKGTYQKPVPKVVLHTILTIETQFRDRVGFFVSDYDVQKPDPFLMVTAPGLPLYVIERWDEPTFRG